MLQGGNINTVVNSTYSMSQMTETESISLSKLIFLENIPNYCMRDTENTMNTTKAQVSLDVEEATYRKLSLMAEELDLTIPKLLERLLLELADSN